MSGLLPIFCFRSNHSSFVQPKFNPLANGPETYFMKKLIGVVLCGGNKNEKKFVEHNFVHF